MPSFSGGHLSVSINLFREKFHFDLIAVPCSAIAVSALASVSDGRLPPAVIARGGAEMKFFADLHGFRQDIAALPYGRGGKHRVSQKSYLIFGKKEQRRSLGDGLTVFVKSSHCAGRCDAGEGLSIQSNILLKTDFGGSLKCPPFREGIYVTACLPYRRSSVPSHPSRDTGR